VSLHGWFGGGLVGGLSVSRVWSSWFTSSSARPQPIPKGISFSPHFGETPPFSRWRAPPPALRPQAAGRPLPHPLKIVMPLIESIISRNQCGSQQRAPAAQKGRPLRGSLKQRS